MKKYLQTGVIAFLCLNLLPAYAQMGAHPVGMAGPGGPEFSGSMGKLFGENSAFTGTMELQVQVPTHNETMTMPGKIAVDNGKSRVEMDMNQAKGGHLPPGLAAHMKAMGMDRMVNITLPDKQLRYVVYPHLKAYAPAPLRDPEAAKPESNFKLKTTKLGKDTVDGHSCIKNKAVVTDDQGNQHEFTVWDATDMKDFPVKIQMSQAGHTITMLFKNVKLSKPEPSLFQPPSDYKKYDTVMAMMQQEMMKRMGGGTGGMHMPPHHP